MLIEAVLDTTVHGPEVYTDFLLETDNEGQADSGDGQKCSATNYQRIAACGSEVSSIHCKNFNQYVWLSSVNT